MANDSDKNDNTKPSTGTRENLDDASTSDADREIGSDAEAVDRLEQSLAQDDGLEDQLERPRLHHVAGADSDGIIHPVDTHVKDKTKIP